MTVPPTFWHFKQCYLMALWHPQFLMRSQQIISLEFPYMWQVIFLLLLIRCCFCLSGLLLWFICVWLSLSLSYLELIDFWCVDCFSSNLQVFNHYFFKKSFFYIPFSLSSPSGALIIHVLVDLMVFHISESLFNFICYFSLFFRLYNLYWLSSSLLILSTLSSNQ